MITFTRLRQDAEPIGIDPGHYIGTVVDNEDPLELHRLRIRIPELHGDAGQVPDDHLPWACPCRPLFMGASLDRSTGSIPRVDAKLLVVHERRDLYSPVYVGELMHETARIEEMKQSYPESYVMKDGNGNKMHFDMERKEMVVEYEGDWLFKLKGDLKWEIDGRVDFEVAKGVSWTIGEDETREIGGAWDATVLGDVAWTIGGDAEHVVLGDVTWEVLGDFAFKVAGEMEIATAGGIDVDSIDPFVIQPPVLSGTAFFAGAPARTFSVAAAPAAAATTQEAPAALFALAAAATPKPKAKLSMRDGQIRFDGDGDVHLAPKGRLRALVGGFIEMTTDDEFYARSAAQMRLISRADMSLTGDGPMVVYGKSTMRISSDDNLDIVTDLRARFFAHDLEHWKTLQPGETYGAVGAAQQNHVKIQGRLVQVVP